MNSSYLKIAIQKSGRLLEKSLAMLNECGIRINSGYNQLRAVCDNFPCEILFLRDDDIPAYIEDGVADVGIVGENVVVEKQKDILLATRLGFAQCRLALAVPRDFAYTDIKSLEGKRIATSYPKILQNFLDEAGIQAEIHIISGSVEIAPSIGLADAICDIVSTGSTLLSNGLKEVQPVMKSEAVLVANHHLNDFKQKLLDKLIFRINAYKKARYYKYILLNAPADQLQAIIELIPGMKSPTVLPLAEPGWISIHSVIQEDDFWEIIEKLQACGAQGILVVPIEKMIL
ncbi:MAG: ATP phosphoribosyltransferase [Cytophagales bacterium]|nr:MAG: ATP phosphoribosyltransferase [Cytophagales bacterium]